MSKPMFAKRHYEAIAQALQIAAQWGEKPQIDNVQCGLSYATLAIADMLARDNPAFDRSRFERACVIGANVKARSSKNTPSGFHGHY